MGAVGGIVAAACVLPEVCVRLHTLALAGDHVGARALQREITPLGVLVTSTYGVPGLKAALDLAGYKGGEPRAPLQLLPAEAKERIRAELARLQSAV
jgi:4-hydroxy-2-oxoglutarate aldolase